MKTSKSQVEPQVLHTDARRSHSDHHITVLPVYTNLLQQVHARNIKDNTKTDFYKLHCNSKSASLSLEHHEIWYPERHHLSEPAAATQHHTQILSMRKKLS